LRSALASVVVVVLAAPVASAAPAVEPSGRWTAAWGTAMHRSVPGLLPNWSQDGFDNQSVRQVVRVTTGGVAVRVRLSNRYGTGPLRLTGATVARAGAGASVRKNTVRALTFAHRPTSTIPAGKDLLSDPVVLATRPLERLAVTLYFARPTGPATHHLFAFSTSYRASGNRLWDSSGAAFTERSDSFYYLDRVDVLGAPRDLVVAFGESVTDGSYATPNAYTTYPDQLAARLVAARLATPRRGLAVLNSGIGGNRVLQDSPCWGDSAPHRFRRDVLDQPGVRTVIVTQALNDLFDASGTISGVPGGVRCNRANLELTAAQLIEGHRRLIRAAHARGIRIIGATVSPYKGNPFGVFTDRGEAARDGLNHWILTSGEYDAVIDFAAVLADPADPDRLNPIYDGTPTQHDAIHPNDAGFAAMAAAIDLDEL
jgi:lysophospholipase L1-like esterase